MIKYVDGRVYGVWHGGNDCCIVLRYQPDVLDWCDVALVIFGGTDEQVVEQAIAERSWKWRMISTDWIEAINRTEEEMKKLGGKT